MLNPYNCQYVLYAKRLGISLLCSNVYFCYNRILLMVGGVPFSFIVLQTLVTLQLLFSSHNAATAFTPMTCLVRSHLAP